MTVSFENDPSIFPNPERGFYRSFQPPGGGRVGQQDIPHPPLSPGALAELRAEPEAITLIRDNILIPRAFWGREISEDFLAELQRNFDSVREAGLKVIVRFHYDWGMTNRDPDEGTILTHLEQLEPLLHRNADVIAWIQAGLYGGCGEASASDQGYVGAKHRGWNPLRLWQGLSDAGRQIYLKMLKITPPERFLAVRYPRFKWDLFGWDRNSAAPLDSKSAFSVHEPARVGYYNQGFMGNAQHYAMYVLRGEAKFAEADSQYAVYEGEISSAGQYKLVKGRVIREMAKCHLTALNCGGDGWSEVAPIWHANGDYAEISRRLGYRYRILTANLPQQVKAGEAVTLSIEMTNDGFARAMNPRVLEVILEGQDEAYALTTSEPRENRLLLPGPGESKRLEFSGELPDGASAGAYQVVLNLPDPSPSLRERPNYSIRLANKDVWDGRTGYNSLNHTIHVEGAAATKPRSSSVERPVFRRIPLKRSG